jgi:hypothetical protein
MERQKDASRPLLAGRKGSGFGDLSASRALLGDSLKGKTVVFAVVDREQGFESTILRAGVFENAKLGGKSDVITHTAFFSGPDIDADVLIVRSSRIFEFYFEDLEKALRGFRAQNPKAAVVLCAFSEIVCERALPLADAGVVNLIEPYPPNDYELLRRAAQILERIRAQ